MDRIVEIARIFYDIADQNELNGLDFQHHSICARRLWLHVHRINYSHFDARMARGKILHETSHMRDTSVEGLMGIAPDRVDWENHQVIEMKGTGGAKEAVSKQVLFYVIMLTARTGEVWSAKIGVIRSKKYNVITLSQDMAEDAILNANSIIQILNNNKAPLVPQIPMCSKCSYRFLCKREK